jgi:hypothetical protein
VTARPVRSAAWLTCLAALWALAACREALPPTHEDIVGADLAAILELQGSPCGEVVGYTLDRKLDYRVECASGDVYRIHVSAEGHVNVRDHSEAGRSQ